MGSPIAAILNTYSPTTGANIAQVVIRCDGTLELHGDGAMARHAVGKLVNKPIPEEQEPPRPAGDRPLKRTRR